MAESSVVAGAPTRRETPETAVTLAEVEGLLLPAPRGYLPLQAMVASEVVEVAVGL